MEKKVFIIYDSKEVKLADALQQLFEHWGLSAFYCRQEDRRDGESYRRELRERLREADLAVLLLSREFEYSQYCQAEAGAVMTMDKRCIAIMVPPASENDLKTISPVLADLQVLVGPPAVATIKNRMAKKLDLGAFPEKPGSENEEKRLVRAVEDRFAELRDEYALDPPRKALIGIWPSLKEGSPAPLAIINSIRNALADAREPTKVAFVGVSLKYSLKWITAALTDLPKSGPRKLTIELVHMDDQSHILHALKDSFDLESILVNFHTDWADTRATWERCCAEAGVALEVLESRIDYIPPRIGIFIDPGDENKCKLFAGRCAVEEKGRAFQLLVGEREYHHYTGAAGDERGKSSIREFRQFLSLYKEPNYNGVVLVPSPTTWLAQLTSCVERYQGLKEITLISSTTTKLGPLIVPALRRGLLVKIYAYDFKLLPEESEERLKVKSIPRKVREEILNDNGRCHGVVELRHYRHLSTFRAALIGEEALGIQMYVHRMHWYGNRGTNSAQQPLPDARLSPPSDTRPSALRFIVTRHSKQFKKVKEDLIEQFLRCDGVDKDPVDVIDC